MRFFGLPFPLMATAGIALPGGGGGDTSAIDTPADTGADLSDTGDTADTTTDDTPAPEGGSEPFKGKAIENGKIAPAAKAAIDEIKAKSPALAKQIANALYRVNAIDREFPGGVQAVKAKIGQLESTIQELGGPDGVKATQDELKFFQDIDQQFTAGDPRFIEALISSPEGQQSFLKLAPSIIDKYAAMHPEGFDAYVAGKFKAELDSANMPLALDRMRDAILEMLDETGKPPNRAVAKLIQIYDTAFAGEQGLYGKVAARAANKPAAPKIEGLQQSNTGPDPREQQLSQREQQVKQSEFGGIWSRELTGVVSPELNRLRTERGFDGNTEAAIKELFATRFDRLVREKGGTASKFFKAGDKAGYQNAVRQLFRTEAPKVLAGVVDHFAPKGTGKKAAPAKAQPQATRPGAAPAPKADAGFTTIRVRPSVDQIDFDKTRALGDEAFAQGKRVLKNGQRVQFKR